MAIWGVYIAPSDNSGWGEDLLGESGTISPNDSIMFDVVSGWYDLKAVNEDGDCYYAHNEKINADYKWVVTPFIYDSDCSAG